MSYIISVSVKYFLFSQWGESCIEIFHAELRSNRSLSSYSCFSSTPSPKTATVSHHLARVDNTRHNILKSRKSHKRMNESEAKAVNYHQSLSLHSQIIPPRMYYSYLVFLALLSHICVSLNVSCFCPDSASSLTMKISHSKSTCVNFTASP